jgi:hypothetical protein
MIALLCFALTVLVSPFKPKIWITIKVISGILQHDSARRSADALRIELDRLRFEANEAPNRQFAA